MAAAAAAAGGGGAPKGYWTAVIRGGRVVWRNSMHPCEIHLTPEGLVTARTHTHTHARTRARARELHLAHTCSFTHARAQVCVRAAAEAAGRIRLGTAG